MNYHTKYFEIEKDCKEKYGNDVIVLKETGMCFQIFEQNSNKNISKVSEILDLVFISSQIPNIYMLGFPLSLKGKYVNVLIKNGYVVVIFDHEWKQIETYLQG